MGRVFILVITCLNVVQVHAQNLLLNGDFENVISKVGNFHISMDSFYAREWIIPTDCTPDIYRDTSACDDQHIKNYDPIWNCIDVQSGKYCAGLGLVSFYGSVEHITGRLSKKLEINKYYKITFYLRFLGGDTTYVSKGFGYKFSQDSIPFKSSKKEINKLAPYYHTLFKENKVYADYQIENEFTSTNWFKVESIYRAKGGEKFITFGLFSYKNDEKIIEQFERINSKQLVIGSQLFLSKIKSNVVRSYIGNKLNDFPSLDNYYFIDNISVEPLSSAELEFAQRTCFNCIDNDPMTFNIPNRLDFFVDKGFFGDLELSVYAVLKPIETLKIQLGKKEEILLNNESDHVQSFEYRFKYPASKVRNTSIVYSIIHTPGTIELQKSYKCIFPMHSNKEIHIYSNIKNIKQ
ncbi:MAG: hypothetical protein LC107_00670 [Chitinophagales bacterium]|nr:hypothetical protein [Chitinophagales bacterium]